MSKRIVIMAGGTGGHVFPALAVAQELAGQGWEVSWLGTKTGLESKVVPANNIAIDWLSVAGVRGKGLFAKITAVFKLLKACWQALWILKRRKPNVVLGMGGFAAAPGGFMAKVLGIPLVIHEQNRIPGTTNRLLAKVANKVLEAFPNSFAPKVKAECTGNPLRKAFLTATTAAAPAIGSEIKILVVGGSQGAQILNQIVPSAVAELSNIAIKHQTGVAMLTEVTEAYHALAVNAETSAFIDDMTAAYQWADLVICRAGAMTISELAAMGKPAILVPLAGAIDDHQTANARFLTDAGAGMLLIQKELGTMTLAEKINQACQQLPQMAQAARSCARLDATSVVADYCKAEAR